MRSFNTLGCLAFAASVVAQSSSGAPFDIGSYLPVSFNNSVTLQPGALFTPSQILSSPTYGVAGANVSASQPYLVVLIDINVALNASNPSNQSQFLHVLQPNLYVVNDTSGNLTFNAVGSNASTAVGAKFVAPIPPPNAIHNYNIFLFRQPANFVMPAAFASYNPPANDLLARTDFNITLFASQGGLGQPLAANYFRVLNGTASDFSTAATQTATSGVAFSTGATSGSASTSVSGTTLTGTSVSTTRSATGSAATPSSSTSAASDTADMGQAFVKAMCIVVAATLPWLW